MPRVLRGRSGRSSTSSLRSVTWSYAIAIAAVLLPAAVGPATAATAPHVQDPASAQTTGARPTGVVVDADGGVIARAHVRIVDADDRTVGATLSDDRGRFALAAACDGCRVVVSLPGFAPFTAAWPAAGGPLRVVLQLAPVQESVVVSGTRDAVPASQVATWTTVFDEAAIARRGAPTVSELLRATPGATVVRTGGLGSVTSLFVRGGDSSYNKVLLDGIPLNEPGGRFNFGNLTTAHLDRVEVARGAQSALFGSDAMASVVQLFTRRGQPGDGPRVGLRLDGGSYATREFGGDVSGVARGLDYAVGLSRYDTDNRSANADFGNTTLSWQAGTDPGARWAVRVVGRLEAERVGTPGQVAFGRPDLDAVFDRDDVASGVTVAHRAGAFRQRLTYAYTRSSQASTNLVADDPYVPEFDGRRAPFAFSDFLYDSFNVLQRHHVSYQADWRIRPAAAGRIAQFVTAVVDVDAERAALRNRLAGSEVPASRNNVGVSAQYQAVAARAAVVAGVRVEENESFGTAVVPRLSTSVTLHDGAGAIGRLDLKVNAGLGVKEPTVLQSFSPSPFFRGNPDLDPERSRTIDAGVEQRLAHDRMKIGAVGFWNRYRNQISTRTTNPATFEAQYFNIGLTQARGLELIVDAVPSNAWRLAATYTFTASEILESTSPSSAVFAAGQWAFRRPRHAGGLEAGWTQGPADVTLFGRFVGRRVDSDFSSLVPAITEAEAYAVWTLAARYRLRAPVALTLRIENLTGREYQEPLGYFAWGRTIHAGLRVQF